MKRLLTAFGATCVAVVAQGAGLEISEDGTTGGLSAIRIAGDASRMNWINPADGTELARVGSQYKWGTGALTADGVRVGWTAPAEVRGETAVYRLTNGVELVRTRRATSDGFFERYAFTNRTDRAVRLAAIDIHTPFHDDYLARGSNWTQRCQSHIWAGGSTAWVCSLRMGGAAPHLGLVVTEGAVTGYSQKERGVKTFHSNFRGVLSLSPPDAALGPGQGFAVAWRVFAHNGKRDFRAKLGELGGVIAEAEDWVVTAREPAVVRFSCARAGLLDGATLRGEGVSVTSAREKGALVATCAYSADCEARVVCRLKDGRETWAELLCRRDPEALIAARAKFIVERQQVAGKSADDPYDGAFVEYDNETNAQVRRWEMPEESRPEIDHTEGAERLGMGVFLAMMAQRGHAELLPALRRYARFVREGLQEPDYTTWGEVARPTRRRHFNYPWVAWFQAEMYAATNEKRHILDAYGTMRAMYKSFRPRPSVALSADRIIELLRKAGCADKADALQAANRKFIDSIIGGADFMNGTEVGFAPELPGSMIPQLLRLWKATGEARYRDVALKCYLPMLEACMGDQPSWHSHDIGLHHWDGYWFGKRMTWGDTLPHDWNGTAVETFDLLAEATGDGTYRARARAIARQLLGLFDSDGRAGCAWILPDRVNDRPARFRDPLANDQDWALVFYLLHGGLDADDAAAHHASEMNPAAYGQTRTVETNGIRVAFLGNSITLHGACPSIGWTNEWGMAASAAEKDYVHLVTRGVERHFGRPASVMVRNLADFERNYRTWSMTNLDEVVAFDPQVLVIALGENAPNLPDEAARKDFYEAFRRLIGTFLDGRRLKPLAVVRGVIWANEAKDAAMADAADDYGIPFVRADIGGQPGMDAKGAGFSHAGVANHPGDRGMAEIAARILEGLFPTKSGFTAKVGGKAVRVRPIRISAMGFNRWPADGLQRPSGQTETAGMVLVEADGATKWRVKAERAFTNAVVRPLAARVRPEVKGGEIAFTLPQPGHYVLELDGIRSPLQMFVEPKRSFADDRKAATLVFGPGNHYAGEVALRSHDRVYIDRDAYVYGSFGMDGVEDVRISGHGVICNTIGRRGNLHCHGGDNATPIWARNSKGIRVKGPTVVDSCCWCIAAFGCEDVEISHVKVTGAWRYNTDGVDLCNSRKVRLSDSFIHSFDDAVVVKGLLPYRDLPVEDIRVERCVCWCSWGGTLETGLETWASAWKGVVFEDCDLIHNARSAMRLNLGGPCRVQDTTFRDIRIEYDASERAPRLQEGRGDRYVDNGKPWTGSWLAIHNGKMYAPGGMYANPGVDPNEPYGSFGTATLENVEITVGPGAPEPKPSIRFGNGVKLGEIELENVRLNGRKVTLGEILGAE